VAVSLPSGYAYPEHCVIAFRSLAATDLALIHRWLSDPCVLKWYAKHAYSRSEVEAKYLPRIDGQHPIHVFVIVVNDRPLGLVQTYRLSDFSGYSASLGAESDWAGLDFFIGEPEYRGRGLGATVLDQFVREEVFVARKAHSCVSGPSPKNLRSIGALTRAGFTYLRTVEVSLGEVEYAMIRCCEQLASKATADPSID